MLVLSLILKSDVIFWDGFVILSDYMWKTLNKHHKRLVFAWCWGRGKPKDTSIDDILKLIEDGPGARRDTGMIEGQFHAVVKLLWNCHQWRVLWPEDQGTISCCLLCFLWWSISLYQLVCACAKAAQGPRCGGVVAILAAQGRLSWGVLTGWLGFPTNVLYLFTTYQPHSYMYIYIDAVLYPYQWPYIYCTVLYWTYLWHGK